MTVNVINMSGLSLEENIKMNFKQAGMETTLAHVLQTRFNAVTLAQKFGIDPEQASVAALLHDVSRLIPTDEYLDMAQTFHLDILPEEEILPVLLHQKLSRVIAVETFDITDKEVLNAISCHTTLKPNASKLDKILFLADKLAWKPQDTPHFMPLVRKQLEKSLDDAAYCYLFNAVKNNAHTLVIHPWTQAALDDLSQQDIAI